MQTKRHSHCERWTGLGLIATLAGSLAAAPSGALQQPGKPAVSTVPVADIVSRMSKDSGLTVLTDSTLKVNAPRLKTATTAANLENQIRVLVKSLPPGTIWGKLYLPEPRPKQPYKGDDVVSFAYASGQLFGPVGAPEPSDTVEVMGRRLPTAEAKEIIARLKLQPVYLLSNPKLGRNGFLVQGPDDGPLISVTPETAAATALSAQPGNVTRVEMGYEKGVPVYQFDVNGADGRKYEVRVDGSTGRVLSNKLD